MSEPNGRIANRRFKLGLVWAFLINANYYLVYFAHKDLSWFTEYAKDMTLWFGLVVGALTVTDFGDRLKDMFNGKK